MAITTRSGKMLSSPALETSSHTDAVEIDWEMVDKSLVVPVKLESSKEKSAKVEQPPKLKHVNDVEIGIRKEVKVAPTEIPRTPPPFP